MTQTATAVRWLVAGALRGRRAQSLSHRLRRLDRDLHGGARHHHRQCRAALHRRRPRGRHRREHLCHHQLSRRQRDRAVDFGLAVDGDRPQALLHDLRRRLSLSRRCCAALPGICSRWCCSASCRGSAAAAWRPASRRSSPTPFRRKSAARPSRSTASRSWSRRSSARRSAAGSPTIIPGTGSS